MNLFPLLQDRQQAERPIRFGLIGAGKFASMFLTQARLIPGLHCLGIADIKIDSAQTALRRVGWPEEQISANSFSDALNTGKTFLTDSAEDLIAADGLEVVIDSTGNPKAGIVHALKAISQGVHIIMVNVEADALVGPSLASLARRAGLVYSLAWGDQPALICEHVDWARTCGFEVVSAGKGTRYLPKFHQSTPETVWDYYHLSQEEAIKGGMNPKMFNSFIDGSKSAIEMTAVSNATGLTPQPDGLSFPPCSISDLAEVLKPISSGGTISHAGTTEVISSLHRDGRPVTQDLMMGTYVVVRANNNYVRQCFSEYRMLPDTTLEFAALYRPTHMIGLELGISVASVVLRGEPTGSPTSFSSDVIAVAKRNLAPGEHLDGEGGYCVWGKQVPAKSSLELGGLPIGLAQDLTLKRPVAKDQLLRWEDVDFEPTDPAVSFRKDMERSFWTDLNL